ncbi:MAG: sigma 54-interacting transcriptional regulator [Pirellulales bacterium]|nr:sigma 54-interacting transcriptional regulator [Pirellulales bacterium]
MPSVSRAWTGTCGCRAAGREPRKLVFRENSLSDHEISLRFKVMAGICTTNAESIGFESLKSLLLEMAQDRSVETLLQALVERLERERDYSRRAVRDGHTCGEIVGQSVAIVNLLRQIDLVAPTDASVLILGESGTGKELVAEEIHKRSLRRDHALVKVNCASIPRDLYESEFFGHVRGAFTGAVKDRTGRFDLADGGTLFLDEVGEIPYTLQGKLLRVLQQGDFERVGEEVTRRVNVRIVAATNRDLKKAVAAGRFRQDLFYRLNVFPIEVAPLRRHKEDIPLLAAHLLERAAASLNSPRPRLTQSDILRLQQYDWPGNVRELWNVIERAVITSRGGKLEFDLPSEPIQTPEPTPDAPAAAPQKVVPWAEMKRRERDNVLAALEQTGWRIYGPQGAAALLGIKPTTLASRIQKMGLREQRNGWLSRSRMSVKNQPESP